MIHYQLSLLNLENNILCNWIGNINTKPLLCDTDIQYGRNISSGKTKKKKEVLGKAEN